MGKTTDISNIDQTDNGSDQGSGLISDSKESQIRNHQDCKIIRDIYTLRSKFLIIGLTGRTGSGCTTVAKIFSTKDFHLLSSNYREFSNKDIDNNLRKDRIIYNFIQHNWQPFTVITASNIIYFFAFQLPFEEFCRCISEAMSDSKMEKNNTDYDEKIKITLENIKNDYNTWQQEFNNLNKYLDNKEYQLETDQNKLEKFKELVLVKLSDCREKVEEKIRKIDGAIVKKVLQRWGDNLREYGQIKESGTVTYLPEAIAEKINQIIKLIRKCNEKKKHPTFIIIDALRNPFEILFFRERYSAFYCMSVNTSQSVRHDKLMKDLKLNYEDILEIDKKESGREIKGISESFKRINIDKCIELSDIHISHEGEPVYRNRDLVNQLFTYLALMLHPGLVSPTPQERLMQIAYTAKLNSGCLSRQVGAVVTDASFSLKAIGWNSTPEGHVPCNLRQLDDLFKHEDEEAFSDYELNDDKFKNHISDLKSAYTEERRKELKGLGLTYCFKNIYTTIGDKQRYNQVHTRSLHAEENAILQISKYGGQGLQGGKLFTTASCCELCAKKAYHIGVKEIYYIDTYPGISSSHIFGCGKKEDRPKLILFKGAVGRAYVDLFNPFLPLKDEIEALTGVDVGSPVLNNISNQKKKGSKNGNNS